MKEEPFRVPLVVYFMLEYFAKTLLTGWYRTSIITKLDTPCIRSNGIPAIHHVKAEASPLCMPSPRVPITKYGMEQRAPYNNPNIPDRMLQEIAESILRSFHAISANRGQLYRYIIHQSPNPYIAPSMSMKVGITKMIRFRKYKVNRIIQNVVSSTLGIPASTILQASIIAIIIAMVVISFVANLKELFDCFVSVLMFVKFIHAPLPIDYFVYTI